MNADRALRAYRRHFAGEPTVLVRAPGRINLIGEHTDYNDGFVLPCAIDRETVVAAGLSSNGRLRTVATDFGDASDDMLLGEPFTPAANQWANYVRGVATALAGEEGFALSGAQLAIAGNVPLGSGLSSSASLEVAVGLALTTLAGLTIEPHRMAQIAQRAENIYVGCLCGIMDQLIAASGVAGHALLIDCRTLVSKVVALPPGVAIVIAHSGIRHAHAGGEYNDRRAQCEEAASHYGVSALRDLDLHSLESGRAGLNDLVYRRARHVVTENARTLAAADALTAGDLRRMGELMTASHASMRDDFEITVPAIDELTTMMSAALEGEGGARMTGGGFGGCVVALAPEGKVAKIEETVRRNYRAPDGSFAEMFVCSATDGAGPLSGT